MLIILGASILDQGITVTFSASVSTFKDVYTNSIGIFLLIFAIATLYLTILSLMKGFEEERSE
jgi:uncharacterized Tic20 family protein